MKKLKNHVYIHLFLCIVLTCALYFAYVISTLSNVPASQRFNFNYTQMAHHKAELPSSIPIVSASSIDEFNIWLIFTKVSNRSPLTFKFNSLIYNLINISMVPLEFNIIVDNKSRVIAEKKLFELQDKLNRSLQFKFYDVEECASKIADIVNAMTPFFSSKPGTYYSDALFYISLGLYRIAPSSQKRAILLDCDLYFKKDIYLLFSEFDRFKPTALFGLAPELTPVYRHILHIYKRKHKTSFGEFYHQRPISHEVVHSRGFQGYNSGVVLINFDSLRSSREFSRIISKESILNMTEKYKFRGHLGDQDFYTLVGFEYPHLIQTINCGFNRQLCTWWKDHGYQKMFDYYFKCDHPVVVLHGNCNTRIPRE